VLDALAQGGRLRFQIAAVGIGEHMGVVVVLAVVHGLPEGGWHPENGQPQQAHPATRSLTADGTAMQQIVRGEQQHHHRIGHHQREGQEERQGQRRPVLQLGRHPSAEGQDRQVDPHQPEPGGIGVEGLRRQKWKQLPGIGGNADRTNGPGEGRQRVNGWSGRQGVVDANAASRQHGCHPRRPLT